MNYARIYESIRTLAPALGGVLSYADCAGIIAAGCALKNSRALARLVKDGLLTRVQKGIYITKDCDLWALASRISKNSYISMDSVLAAEGLCGTVPAHSASAVHAGRNRTVETPFGTIYFHAMAKKLFFGLKVLPSGVRVADAEKAFLDILYYHTKGARFVIDPLREIDARKLDIKKLENYLSYYKNPKFKTFVKGVLHER